jgi:hypothetical protein
MRLLASGGLYLCAVLASTAVALANCDPTSDPDKSDIANARAAIAANCDCEGVGSRGAYVRCAVQQANTILVNKSCAGVVKKCASKSTCRRPGFVTCCRTDTRGEIRCATKSSAARCMASRRGGGCVDTFASCCDACTATSRCAPTTTATTTTLPQCGSFPACSGPCPTDSVCLTNNSRCECFPRARPCFAGPYPTCGGLCPPPAVGCFPTNQGICRCA